MTPDNQREPIAAEASPQDLRAADDKRVAARRRFLRVGAGGSAALVMTVTHKRSFAGGCLCGISQVSGTFKPSRIIAQYAECFSIAWNVKGLLSR